MKKNLLWFLLLLVMGLPAFGDLVDDGNALFYRGDYDGAIADYSKAIELKPDDELAYYSRGLMKDDKKDYDGAIADYTKAIELRPDYAVAYYHRGEAKECKQDYDGAIADYTKAIELKPYYAVPYYDRGHAKNHKGDYGGAIADYSKAIELEPDDADAYNNRGVAKSHMLDFDGAIADYSKVIELKPDNARGYYNRGVAKEKKGDYDGVIADCTKAIELKSDYAGAYNERGWANYSKNNYDDAITDATHAIQLDSTNGLFFGTRGWARYSKGDVMGALADLKKAVELDDASSDSALAAYDQGLIDFISGNFDSAVASWQNAGQKNATYLRELQPWIDKAKQRAIAGGTSPSQNQPFADWTNNAMGEIVHSILSVSNGILTLNNFGQRYAEVATVPTSKIGYVHMINTNSDPDWILIFVNLLYAVGFEPGHFHHVKNGGSGGFEISDGRFFGNTVWAMDALYFDKKKDAAIANIVYKKLKAFGVANEAAAFPSANPSPAVIAEKTTPTLPPAAVVPKEIVPTKEFAGTWKGMLNYPNPVVGGNKDFVVYIADDVSNVETSYANGQKFKLKAYVENNKVIRWYGGWLNSEPVIMTVAADGKSASISVTTAFGTGLGTLKKQP